MHAYNVDIHSNKLTVHFLSTSFDDERRLLNDINVGCVYVGRDGVPSNSFLILKASSITGLGVVEKEFNFFVLCLFEWSILSQLGQNLLMVCFLGPFRLLHSFMHDLVAHKIQLP